MKKKKVYISGPISGLAREDFMKRFAIADQMLRKQGFRVCNPTRIWVCRWQWLYWLVGYKLTLCYDLWLLMRCDRIFFLPYAYESRGVCIESVTAYYMKIPELEYDEWHKAYHAVNEYVLKMEGLF